MKGTGLGREFVGEKQLKILWRGLTKRLKILDSVRWEKEVIQGEFLSWK